MIDPNNHVIDPVTGFAIHKDDGHIIGLEQATPVVAVGKEWPKWVKPHDSQVVRKEADGYPTSISTPGFAESHVNRTNGEVGVLVADEDEEKRALGEYKQAEDGPFVDNDVIRRAVRRDIHNANAALSVSVNEEEAEKQLAIEDEEVARRVAEQQELSARNAETALEAAKAQRERLAEKLGGSVDPSYVPSKPYVAGERVGEQGRRSEQRPFAPPYAPVQRLGTPGVARLEEDTTRSGGAPSTPLRDEAPLQHFDEPSIEQRSVVEQDRSYELPRTEQPRVPGQPVRGTPTYPETKG